MLILAVDPGKTTGLALLYVEGEKVTIISTNEVKKWDGLEELLDQGVDQLVIEHFFLMRGNVSQTMLDPIKVIGVLEFLAKERNIPIHMQTPAQREFATSRFASTIKLFSSHSRSALSHGLCYVHNVLGITHPIITKTANDGKLGRQPLQ